jgi:hypothetical protein
MGILIVIILFAIIGFSFYKYVKRMKDKKVDKPHCGACE